MNYLDTPAAPDISTEQERIELVEIARWIETYREKHGITKTDLCKRFPGIGSDSTYGKIRKDALAELDVSSWLPKYRSVQATIQIIVGKSGRLEPVYDDLSMAIRMENAYMEVINEKTAARFALGQAASGCGKTSAIRALTTKYTEGVLCVEAHEIYKDRPERFLRDIMRAVGNPSPAKNSEQVFEDVLKKLRERQVCVVIDEAHHMGPKCLNIVKTLINQTPASFVLLALPTLWGRLEKETYQEVHQLTTNRLASKFVGTLELSDVLTLLERGVRWEDAGEAETHAKRVAPLLMQQAVGKGNLAFVRAVVNAISERTIGRAATLPDYTEAVAEKGAMR